MSTTQRMVGIDPNTFRSGGVGLTDAPKYPTPPTTLD